MQQIWRFTIYVFNNLRVELFFDSEETALKHISKWPWNIDRDNCSAKLVRYEAAEEVHF